MIVRLKSSEEIELLKENAILVSKTLAEVGKAVKPGVTTKELDSLAEAYIRDNGAVPGFLNYEGFPYTLCISVNDTVVHGYPSDYTLKEGDIVSVDCGTVYKGYNGDSAYTFPVGEICSEDARLLEVTKSSLCMGAQKAVAGNRIGDIGSTIQTYCEAEGFSVVRELVGHGIGKRLHENPEVPNFGRPGQGKKLAVGMVICIEPMINAGTRHVYVDDNGWSVKTVDGKKSAHFEYMVAIRENGPQILTTYEYIENIK